MGHAISPNSVRKLLVRLGFSRQVNRKADEGANHPDRDAQFEHINARVIAAQAAGEPVISVDTKKKELVGANEGWVSIGITADTAEFAVQSIRTWRARRGRARDPTARSLTITPDCGGANGARVRLWKTELQKLADETGLIVHVHHYPPGTSKWNRIEHRLFCHITQNWRGRPLTDRLAVVELIGATTTRTGFKVACAIDARTYEKGVKVSNAEMASLNITGDQFHPEWNYTIKPRQSAIAKQL